MDISNQITVTLSPELAGQIQAAVRAGDYGSSDDIISQAMADWGFLYAYEKAEDSSLRLKIEQGYSDVAAGRVTPFELSSFLSRVRQKFHIE